MADCKGIFGRVFGHDYRARYSESQALPADIARMVSETAEPWKEEVLHAATTITTHYHGDVCRRCGDTRGTKEARNV